MLTVKLVVLSQGSFGINLFLEPSLSGHLGNCCFCFIFQSRWLLFDANELKLDHELMLALSVVGFLVSLSNDSLNLNW